jgi:hypothetical protein
MSADDRYEQQNDGVTGDVPAGDAQDNDYVSRPGQKDGPVPVQSDSAGIDDPIDEANADSDEQLGTICCSLFGKFHIGKNCSEN